MTTEKETCNLLVEILYAHGVRRAVVSPGSRNAPLLMALARFEGIEKFVIVDERSAAFAALGMSQQTGEPVAIVCTSGTALLNYAPAVAEAYYQKLPLIVVSADRPREWIDQDDSQTIRQFEALSQFVKQSYDLPSRCDDGTARWYVNRMVNDAMMIALSGRRAPVHINVQLDEPLTRVRDRACGTRIIRRVSPRADLPEEAMARLVDEASGKKVLIIAGFMVPDLLLEKSLRRLSTLPNVVVLVETVANLTGTSFVRAIDRTLLAITKQETLQYVPDLLITTGGAIVSRMVKTFLRHYPASRQWYVGVSDTTVDCMQTLTTRIDTDPGVFFSQFAACYDQLKVDASDYARLWHEKEIEGLCWHEAYVAKAPWSDLKALSYVFRSLPSDCRLQLSNGTTIRYAQLFGDSIRVRNDCNRGVSGIDGSTSTALGASLVYANTTILVTGDMSFLYDLSGLSSSYNTERLKIIVMCNGGGGIFRFIKSTSMLPELEHYFEVRRDIPVDAYARAFGFAYFEAADEGELSSVFPCFISGRQASILAIRTENTLSAAVLKAYFEREDTVELIRKQ